jgi:hypothetical protein
VIDSRRRSHLKLATLAAIFLVTWSLTTHGKYSATGDEPHYLMIAQSLRADRDLDLANNYAQHDGGLFGAPGLEAETHAATARDGRLRPVHDIGVPVILLPAYVLATRLEFLPPETWLDRFRMTRGLFAYSLISLVVIGVTVAAAALTFAALERNGLSSSSAALVVSVAWLSPPILSNAFLVFPEQFALLATAWAVLEWSSADRPWDRRAQLFCLALGCLPWTHRKFALYALALLVTVLVTRWRSRSAQRASSVVTSVLLFALPQVALALWSLHYWGTLAGPLALNGLPFGLERLRDGIPALLVDRENGLFWWAPVYLLVPLGWWLRRKALSIWLLPMVALIVPAAAHQWWAGFSPAARFIVPLVPICCLAGVGILLAPMARRVATVLLIPQAFIAAYGWQHPRLLWPRGDGVNRVLSAVSDGLGGAASWLPSFRTDSGQAWLPTVILLGGVLLMNTVLAVWCSKSMRI